MRKTRLVDTRDRGPTAELERDHGALRVVDLRDQAAVERSRLIAVCEASSAAGNQLLDRVEAYRDPVPPPALGGVRVETELGREIALDAQIVERLDLARDVQRRAPHQRALGGTARKQRRL